MASDPSDVPVPAAKDAVPAVAAAESEGWVEGVGESATSRALTKGQVGRGEELTEVEEAPGGEMGFLDHLEEFRVTVIKCVVALIIGMVAVGAFFPWFFKILKYPLRQAMGEDAVKAVLNTTNPFGIFSVIFEVTFFGGIGVAMPFVAYFIIHFVAPGLTTRERGYLRPALASALVLFLTGALSSYFFILPLALKFAAQLNEGLEITMIWTADTYYDLVTWMTLGCGLVFEFPLILVILQVLGVVETATLRKFWRHAMVIIVVIAAVVTPSPDMLSQCLMAGPMIILFWGSLWVGSRMRRKRVKAAEAEEAAEAARNS